MQIIPGMGHLLWKLLPWKLLPSWRESTGSWAGWQQIDIWASAFQALKFKDQGLQLASYLWSVCGFFRCVLSPTYGLTMTDLSYSGVLAAVNSNKSICCIRTMPMNLKNWMELRLSNWSAVWQAWVGFWFETNCWICLLDGNDKYMYYAWTVPLVLTARTRTATGSLNCLFQALCCLACGICCDLTSQTFSPCCRSRRLDIRRLRQQLAGYVACSAQEVRTRFWSGNSALRDFGVDTLS